MGTPLRNRNFATIGSSSLRTVADRHRLAAYHNKPCSRALGGINVDDLEWPWTPKIGFLVNFLRFQAVVHILRVKPFKIDQDNLHMKCSALNVHFNGVRFDLLGSRSPPYKCIKFGYPIQNVSTTVVQSSKRTVADGHRLAAYHNKHCWRAFRGYQHRWPSTTLNPKNMGF